MHDSAFNSLNNAINDIIRNFCNSRNKSMIQFMIEKSFTPIFVLL